MTLREELPLRFEGILTLAGLCLILLQFFMIREITALLRGTEIVIFLVTVAYFCGYSVGYGVSKWLSLERLLPLAWGMGILHLTLPFSLRYLGGFFYQQAAGRAFWLLLFVTAFVLSSFYSLLLPRLIDSAREGPQSLIRLYSAELIGAMLGVFLLLTFGSVAWFAPILYQVALASLIVLLCQPTLRWLPFIGVALYVFLSPWLEENSLNYRYRTLQGFKAPRVLYSVNSLYQKVDIVLGQRGRPYIYLNGRENYGSTGLSQFNLYLSAFPARLLRPREALIVGSGSMESVKYISQFAKHVTSVELDSAVIAGSRKYLGDINQLDRIHNWTLIINDAKQYLGHTRKLYDLIVMDVPAPTTIQVGLLHSIDFYQLARKHLTPQGVLSVSLCGHLNHRREIPRTVAAALVKVFDKVLVLSPSDADYSFALSSTSFSFSREDLQRTFLALEPIKEQNYAWARIRGQRKRQKSPATLQIIEPPELLQIIGDLRPLSVNNMKRTLRWSWNIVKDRYFSR